MVLCKKNGAFGMNINKMNGIITVGDKVTIDGKDGKIDAGKIADESKLSVEDNIGVVSDNNGNLKVRMAKDLKGLESVTTKDVAGNTTVMNEGAY
ncbi:hypothetical protein HMPREF1865_01914 [Veillonella parvula]|nr:hypothetical protein HMPREF1865_01914 [Veillonella parvula]